MTNSGTMTVTTPSDREVHDTLAEMLSSIGGAQ